MYTYIFLRNRLFPTRLCVCSFRIFGAEALWNRPSRLGHLLFGLGIWGKYARGQTTGQRILHRRCAAKRDNDYSRTRLTLLSDSGGICLVEKAQEHYSNAQKKHVNTILILSHNWVNVTLELHNDENITVYFTILLLLCYCYYI